MSKLDELIAELCPNGVGFSKIGDTCSITKGNTPIQKAIPGEYQLVVTTAERKTSSSYQFDKAGVCIPLVSSRGHGVASLNEVFYQEGKYAVGNILCCVIPKDNSVLSAKFLHLYLNYAKDYLLVPQMKGGANVSLSIDAIARVRIPIPPLPVQNEVIAILEKFSTHIIELTAELTARKKQYEYYRNLLLSSNDVEWMTLPQISTNCDRQRKPVTKGNREAGIYPYYGASGIVDYVAEYLFDGDFLSVSEDGANLLARSTPIAFSISGKNWVNNHAHVLKFKTTEMQKYVEMYLNSIDLSKYISGGAQPKLNQDNLNKIPIPVPTPEKVKRIVDILLQFDTLCADMKNGLPAEIEARQKQYEYYRDKLLTFKEKEA